MQQYHDLLKEILGSGNVQYEPRTEEYILGISGRQSTYDLTEGFPLITSKNVPIRLLTEELFWKLRGERNIKSLFDNNIHIWDANAFDRYLKTNKLKEKFPKHSLEWNAEFVRYKERLSSDADFAKEAGDLGPVYGYQWRHWKKPVLVQAHSINSEWVPEHYEIEEVDQLKNLLKNIQDKPGARYHILNAWNPGDLPDMAIGPCPFWHQFTVYGDKLDLTAVQRSCDVFLGVPFNIAQDAILTHLVANETGLQPRKFHHVTVNTHAYLGVPPRSNFWTNPENVEEFQGIFNEINKLDDYMGLRSWYLQKAPEESPGNERKDHIPFILEQLSKSYKDLPTISIRPAPLLELIEEKANEMVFVNDYNPELWDSKANVAA